MPPWPPVAVWPPAPPVAPGASTDPSQVPAVQPVHCELVALVQITGDVQPAIGVQARQAPPLEKVPAAQAPQIELAAEVQVGVDTQCATALQARQVSAVPSIR
jgi:hypothetical protein